jgi:hypothetical protein
MRIVLAIVLALAVAGCAKKSKPPAAPATTEMKSTESAPGGATPDEADEDKAGDPNGSQTRGDPCDGGETKGK